jgi:hypothetical protein
MVAPFIESDRKRAWLSGVPVCLAHNLRADWVQAVGGYQSAAATTRTVRSTLRSAVRGRQGERVICRPHSPPRLLARAMNVRQLTKEERLSGGRHQGPAGVGERYAKTTQLRTAAFPVNLKEPSSSNADSGCMRPAAIVAKSADALHRPSVLRAQAGHDPSTEYSATGPLLGAAS